MHHPLLAGVALCALMLLPFRAAAVGLTDVAITITDGVGVVAVGGQTTYTIVVTADPSTGAPAQVTCAPPPGLTFLSWSCTGVGGATCAASGAGAIDDAVVLPAGGAVTYLVVATLPADLMPGSYFSTAANVVPPADPNPANNSAVDTDAVIGAANGASCISPEACASGVCFPGDLTCGYPDGEGACVAEDTSVCRSNACSADLTCMAAGGCNVDADCAAGLLCDAGSSICEDPSSGDPGGCGCGAPGGGGLAALAPALLALALRPRRRP